jgi:ankyrin repeat protein
VQNINAQDENPLQRKTALHWAAIKGHEECYIFLKSKGARSDIPDASLKIAEQYKILKDVVIQE